MRSVRKRCGFGYGFRPADSHPASHPPMTQPQLAASLSLRNGKDSNALKQLIKNGNKVECPHFGYAAYPALTRASRALMRS